MKKKKITLVPAILSDNIKEVKNKIRLVEKLVDKVHIDVMDGLFVPNKTFPVQLLNNVKTRLKLQVHLMVYKPELYIPFFKKVYEVIFHIEATPYPEKIIKLLRKRKIKVGIALNPETSPELIQKIVNQVDTILIMSVHPGHSGYPFIPQTLNKIQQIQTKAVVSVDGGINKKTALEAIDEGANELISGTAIFKGNVEQNIKDLWKTIKQYKPRVKKKKVKR